MASVALALALVAAMLLRPAAAAAPPPPIPRQVFCAVNASAPERHAAQQLVHYLRLILGDDGAVPPVRNATAVSSVPQLAVGYGAARLLGVPAARMAGLGREGYVLQPTAARSSLALSGGRGAPRGTLYAVVEFLEAVGVQFLAADVTVLPKQLPSALPLLRPRYVPKLEYRQTFGFQMLAAPEFNVHLRLNKAHYNNPKPALDAMHGGVYPVFASPPGDSHTSYSLLDGINHGLGGPPLELFNTHRGWFWPQADNASGIYGQLCWSNRSLQDFLVKRVKSFLADQPQATLLSVSQNDNSNMCRTKEELAIVQAEGGARMGPMLRAINYIADHIKTEYPSVAIHTLAYGPTVDPPRTAARPNVVVQLAPIGADYGRPFTAPSNKPVRDHISAWAKKCERLFVWNYVTGFECFLLPFPNYKFLANDIKFMAENRVTGIFNEAAYTGPGGDFAEHNDYVVSRVMFEPSLNGTQLSAQFLRGYYGEAAAPRIQEYMDILTDRMLALDYYMQLAGWDMTVFAPIFDVETVVKAGTALKAALDAAVEAAGIGGNPAYAERVEMSSLSIYWVLIHRFGELQFGCRALGLEWPFQRTNEQTFATFSRIWNASGDGRYNVDPSLGEGDGRTLKDIEDETLQVCPNGVKEGQLITLFNAGIRNATGERGPEVIVTAQNASSWGERYCPPGDANDAACHYTFSVLGHWVSAVAPTVAAPQWLEWQLSLRPGMGIGRVQALQLPAEDGWAHHQLLFDEVSVAQWSRNVAVDATTVKPAPSFCQVVFSAIVDCPDTTNASSCASNPPIVWAMPSVKVNISPNPAARNNLTQGCRRDLLFEYSPPDSHSKAVKRVRLETTETAGNWVAWSAVTFTLCPLHGEQVGIATSRRPPMMKTDDTGSGTPQQRSCEFREGVDFASGNQDQPSGWPKPSASQQVCCQQCNDAQPPAVATPCAAAVWDPINTACWFKSAEDVKHPGKPFKGKPSVACVLLAHSGGDAWAHAVLLLAGVCGFIYLLFALFNYQVRGQRGLNILPLVYEARETYGLVLDGVAFTMGRRRHHRGAQPLGGGAPLLHSSGVVATPPQQQRSQHYSTDDGRAGGTQVAVKGAKVASSRPQSGGTERGSALHRAASRGDAEQLRDLLRAEPTLLNSGDGACWTSFHLCCAGGHVECARILMEAGCDTELVNKDGLTGLQVAKQLHARSQSDASLPRAGLANILRL